MDRIRSRYITVFIALFLAFLSTASRGFSATEEGSDKGIEGQQIKELIVGTAVKLFAKTYIAVSDIDKIKEANIAKLEKMDDREFADKYASVYSEMKGLPDDVKTAYGIDEKMDKSALINKIRSADRKDLYTIIDNIPDAFISKHFDTYVKEKNMRLGGIPSKKDILNFWDNIRKNFSAE